MAARRYSRLANIEDRKNRRRTFIFIVLTLAMIGLLFWFGIGLTPKLINFASSLSGNDSVQVTTGDNTPPPPPTLDLLPEFTADSQIKISGNTEAGATVTIFFNNTQKELVANSEGNFTTTFSLLEGENTVRAVSQDEDGNKSAETKTFTILLDQDAPSITINKPLDQAVFFGNEAKKITIEGETDSNASLTINGRVVIVSGDGRFSMPTTLEAGKNNFELIAIDQAGNETKTTLTVEFSP